MKSARLAGGAGWFLFAVPLIFWRLNPVDFLDAEGWLWALHALHLLMTAGAVLLLYLAGRAALAAVDLLPDDPLESVLLSTGAGFFIVCLAVYLIGAAGALHPLGVLGLAAIGFYLATRKIEYAAPPASDATALEAAALVSAEFEAAAFEGNDPARTAAYAFGGFLVLLFAGSMIEALYPSPHSPDALAYNLAFARLFANSGGVVPVPESPYFFATSGYWEIFLTALALFVSSDVSLLALAQLLHVILGLGGSVLAIVCLVRRLTPLGRWETLALGLFAAVLFAGMRIDVYHVRRFPLLIVAPKSDLFIVALQAAGALAFFEAVKLRGARAWRWALLGGLLIGVASGVKLTAGLAAVGLGTAFMIYPPSAISLRERVTLAGWAAAGVAAALVPMLAKNLIALGNPLYPLLASYFGELENPRYFAYFTQGFADVRASRLDTGLRMFQLTFPSAPFVILIAALWRGVAVRGVHFLFFSLSVSVAVSMVVFTGKFPSRYALFVSAFSAVCAAAVAGGLIERLRERIGEHNGTGRFFNSPRALPAAWVVLFALAVIPTHLDNRIKRALRTAQRTPVLHERILRMNPASRFQAGWPGRLPEGARPLTFYRSERLFAFTKGWRPAVAVESPELMTLFLRGLGGPEMEKALVQKGFTHIYFEWPPPRMPGFPIDIAPLTAHLRGRNPLFRAVGFEMYAIGG